MTNSTDRDHAFEERQNAMTMTSKTKPKAFPIAPRTLSKEAKAWWDRLVSQWQLDDAGLMVLGQALESFDRMRQAQAVLKSEGITTVDRFGQSRQHPATLIERDARSAMLRAFKQLSLETEAPVS